MNCRSTHIGTATMLLEIGSLRFTSNASDAVRIIRALNPQKTIPIHYEGWKHFREPKAEAEKVFTEAGINGLVHWLLPLGKPVEVTI